VTTASQSTDWQMLREFAAVDLEQSFVLSWDIESGALLVDIDLHLLPAHPFYEKPRPAEKVCIRPAVIEFPICDKIEVAGNSEQADIQTAAREIGLGAIKGLRRLESGHYEIDGIFGLVKIDAERLILRIKEL
jgi:hypothetical protein